MKSHYSRLGRSGESRALHDRHIEEMRGYYSRTASQYNDWHCDTAADSNHNFAVSEVLRLLKRHPSSTLLDVACGTGRCIAAALAAGFDAQGIDLCAELLALAEKELSIPRQKLHCGDATALPFRDNSFDVSCILGALHHSAMPHTIITEMVRVTRHAIVISDEANHLHGGVRQLLMACGIFEPIYRLLFRRPPRTARRGVNSDGDGPGFDFTIEELVPALKTQFASFKSTAFYRIGRLNVRATWLPRLFATQAVVVVEKKLT